MWYVLAMEPGIGGYVRHTACGIQNSFEECLWTIARLRYGDDWLDTLKHPRYFECREDELHLFGLEPL